MENIDSECFSGKEGSLLVAVKHSWLKSFSWLGLSTVGVIGYLSQRDWFIHATNLWIVGVFEGAVC